MLAAVSLSMTVGYQIKEYCVARFMHTTLHRGACAYTLRGYNDVRMKTEIKNSITNRLRRIEGQVRGIQKMVDREQYCVDIITQSSAVRSALSAIEDLLLENHLSEHVIHQMKQGQEKKAIGEIITIFKKAKKK